MIFKVWLWKNIFLQFRRVHKTSSFNLFAFKATLKESTVRIFLHKEENEKNPNFIVVIIFQSIGYFILSCDVALLDLYV